MIFPKQIIHSIILFYFFQSQSFCQKKTNPLNQSVELGKVHWYRDYMEAIADGKKEKRDIVLLFQEVPGCSTCRNYGHNVLSHPLMVEALENTFIPLVIFNNKGGEDRNILKKFKEPSWNNPVVRIIDTNGKNLVKRISNDYSALALIKRMKETLKKRKKNIPIYMDLLEQELSSFDTQKYEQTTYEMYCFWNGEKQLGKIDGVLNVESGFYNTSEVVKTTYNPELLSKSKLDSLAKEKGFKPLNSIEKFRLSPNDLHYYLQHSDYRFIPLTDLQKTKINSTLGDNKSAEKYLSPQQLKWLHSIRSKELKKDLSFSSRDFKDAWYSLKSLESN